MDSDSVMVLTGFLPSCELTGKEPFRMDNFTLCLLDLVERKYIFRYIGLQLLWLYVLQIYVWPYSLLSCHMAGVP
jgi:hypothetical protein